jgi:heat shock protein HslJ
MGTDCAGILGHVTIAMKNIILGILLLGIVAACGGGAYYFATHYSFSSSLSPLATIDSVAQSDSAAQAGPAAGLSFAKRTFVVPPTGSSTTELIYVAATSIRDYPMGRYTTEDGQAATLMAYEDYVSSFENNLRVIPISINIGNTGEQFYLAVLEGEEMKHTTSFYIGEQIRLQAITRSGNQISVSYFVHDRDQTFAERPRISTTAIYDIVERKVVQAGRTPKSEAVVVMKDFKGKYMWVKTVPKDGDEVTPNQPDKFGLLFNTNQIEIQTDCNLGNASFSAEAGSSTVFTLGEIAATKMFCESAQETIYFDMFKQVDRYEEAANGDLTLYFRDDAGYMEFVPAGKTLEFEATSTATSI